MKCPRCQQPLVPRATFCGCCGVHLSAAAASGLPHTLDVGSPVAVLAGGLTSEATTAFSATGTGAGLMARVQGILLSPKATWATVAREGTPALQLFSGYVVPLSLLAVIAMFVQMAVTGVSLPFGGTFRTPILAGLTNAVLSFVMSLIGVSIVRLIVNLLAPPFGGARDSRRALQVAVYSLTPTYVSVLFGFLPAWGTLLSLLAGLYGIYVLYLGLPIVMRAKREKAVSYTVCVVIGTLILGALLAALTATLGVNRAGGVGALNGRGDREARQEVGAAAVGNAIGGMLDTDEKGKAGLAAALSNLARSGEQLQNRPAANGLPVAGASMHAGRSSTGPDTTTNPDMPINSDPAQNHLAAVGGLMAALGGALGGPRHYEPVDFHQLEALLPPTLIGMSRTHAEGRANQAVGVKGISATATYQGAGAASVQVHIADVTAVSGLVEVAHSLAGSTSSESDTGYEKDVQIAGRSVHEKYNQNAKHGEVSTLVSKRFEVDVTGDAVAMQDLERALTLVDFGAFEALKDSGAGPAEDYIRSAP